MKHCDVCLYYYLPLKLGPKPQSETLPERGGRKPEADRRLSDRLRSVDDAARDGGPGASGCSQDVDKSATTLGEMHTSCGSVASSSLLRTPKHSHTFESEALVRRHQCTE